ncbi:MAG: hypothetical protein HY548_05015 [Elusimicrobia bacterium]|nr:hypothetical protein [Elusimicrobiota bacterium]
MFNLPIDDFALTTTADYYHGEDNTLKNNNFGGSLFLSQGLWNEWLTLKGGTAYYLYRFNLFAGNESTDVQTYFASAQVKVWKELQFRGGYEFEHNDVNNFHSADARLIWSF